MFVKLPECVCVCVMVMPGASASCLSSAVRHVLVESIVAASL